MSIIKKKFFDQHLFANGINLDFIHVVNNNIIATHSIKTIILKQNRLKEKIKLIN